MTMASKNPAIRLLRDDSGVLSSIDYILFVTILTIGSAVGLATVRDAVMQQLGDISVAVENLDQSYTVDITFRNGSTQRFGFEDGTSPTDVAGEPPGGIEIVSASATDEG
jgi:hypothetical protein